MENKLTPSDHQLFSDIRRMVEETRQAVSQTVNAGLTLLYWNIGKRINDEVLQNKRAAYGEQILPTLSAKLVEEYGNGYSERNLKRMLDFSARFTDFQIVASLSRQLSWSHFIEIIPFKSELERDFYAHLCRLENWSVRTLREKIRSMLFERTAISGKPEELAKLELQALKEEDKLTPDLVFKDPYILDFSLRFLVLR